MEALKLAFAISAVPSRRAMARALAQGIDGCVQTFVDDPPSGGAWNNYRRMLLSAGGVGEDWLVCLDDDAILCDLFEDTVQLALRSIDHETDFASFYFGNRRVTHDAIVSGACWIKTLRVVHGICWAIRPTAALEAIAVVENNIRPDYKPGDQRLLAWLALTGRHNYASIPSLVDHRQDATSVMANTYGVSNEGVRAACFEKIPPDVWTSKSFAHRDLQSIALEKLHQDGAFKEGIVL